MATHISQSSNFREILYDCQEIIGMASVLIASEIQNCTAVGVGMKFFLSSDCDDSL